MQVLACCVCALTAALLNYQKVRCTAELEVGRFSCTHVPAVHVCFAGVANGMWYCAVGLDCCCCIPWPVYHKCSAVWACCGKRGCVNSVQNVHY